MLLKPKLILNNNTVSVIFSREKRSVGSCSHCLYNSCMDKTRDCRCIYIDKDLSLYNFCSMYSFKLYIPGKLRRNTKLYNYAVKEKIIIKKT